MEIALFGHNQEDGDDPQILVPPSFGMVDARVMQGPASKARREDLQVWSWLTTLGWQGHLHHPLSLAVGADPPDRLLHVGEQTYGLELSELTLQALRGRLSRIRRVGRDVEHALRLGDFGHLVGRSVSLQDISTSDAGDLTTSGIVTREIVTRLQDERGYIGEGLEDHDYSAGMPAQIPSRGMYGDVEHVVIQVNLASPDAPVTVQASAQCAFSLSEARRLLWDRVHAKDTPGNQVLLLSTGLVDSSGYACPVDRWLFHCLQEHGPGQPPEDLRHLDAVALHHFGEGDWLVAYQRPGSATPWTEPTA
jgi:hypothetical protein